MTWQGHMASSGNSWQKHWNFLTQYSGNGNISHIQQFPGVVLMRIKDYGWGVPWFQEARLRNGNLISQSGWWSYLEIVFAPEAYWLLLRFCMYLVWKGRLINEYESMPPKSPLKSTILYGDVYSQLWPKTERLNQGVIVKRKVEREKQGSP